MVHLDSPGQLDDFSGAAHPFRAVRRDVDARTLGDGIHRVSLDEVIITMRGTGKDMSSRYKETAMGGLAVNVVEC